MYYNIIQNNDFKGLEQSYAAVSLENFKVSCLIFFFPERNQIIQNTE